MKSMNVKERYARFRHWQLHPFSYEMKSTEQHHCANCDHDYTGNFCPYCSQKAGMGKVTWRSVRDGIMEVWGMGNRSMSYSIWQLLWRPGYFISDYISGRRQVSFPPVKMLLILAVIITLIEKLIGVEKEPAASADLNRQYDLVNFTINWINSNIGWGMLAVNSFLIIPTWLLFRYAPRHYHHSLPAGFFIQVFQSVLWIFLTFISDIVGHWFLIVLPVYFFVTYRQLFGYGVWATMWRVMLMVVSAFAIAIVLTVIAEYIIRPILIGEPVKGVVFIGIPFVLAVLFVPMFAAFLIGRWRYHRRQNKTLQTINPIDYVRKNETTPRPDTERDS